MHHTVSSNKSECPLMSSLLNLPVAGHKSEGKDGATAEVLQQYTQEISQCTRTFLLT
jgi:hypothetical protein